MNIFQNAQALSVSVGNIYSEYQLIHTFIDNFHQGGKYSAQIFIHQEELGREEKSTDQKYLSILSLQTDYLNIDGRLGCSRNNEGEHPVQIKCTFCGGANYYAEKIQKDQKRKGKRLCSWWFVQQTNGMYESEMFQMCILRSPNCKISKATKGK